MKRDCGKGELIPAKYSIVWCIGDTDEENKKNILDPLSKEYEDILATLPKYSNIRMYVWDKAGYANCIRATFIDFEGIATESTNRIAELGKIKC